MLTLTREQGQSIYIGRRLSPADLEGTYDYRIDFDAVDHRVGTRRIEVAVLDRFDANFHTLTPQQPDLDFGQDIRLSFLTSHEYIDGGEVKPVARIGIRAPREMRILRDNARACIARNEVSR